MPASSDLPVPCSRRLRRLPRSFAWIDHRLRSRRLWQDLSAEELALYLFLALAADKKGLSCWPLRKIEAFLPWSSRDRLIQARCGLCRKNLLAFRPWRSGRHDGVYQVVSLEPATARPSQPPAALGDLLPSLAKD